MLGKDINALNIYIEGAEQGSRALLLSIHGQQGDEWRKTILSIVSAYNFRIVIEGTTGASDLGDIGLDDISFTPGCRLAVGASLPPVLPTSINQSGGADQQIWALPATRPTPHVWHNATALIPSCVSEFQLVFELQD
ncbi:hypothetical protein C0Q70_05246 [Pomacea canaliculata]|uniref:MAM domain-containing protein n=1 Tax=Pomacea canaliculata TaxID=400727 RepID=A0A2T7PKQ2_POMCA|nr:hypothetical protein C0Q70_05246 [Pomacea canaliculata]